MKTSRANENGKLMAVRKKYANKKFAKISQIAGKNLIIMSLICAPNFIIFPKNFDEFEEI